MPPEDTAIAPKLKLDSTGALIHSAVSSGTNGPVFSPAQRNDIAQKVGTALTDSVAMSGDEQTSATGVAAATIAASTASPATPDIPALTLNHDFDDSDWVIVGADEEMDFWPVAKTSMYVYKKEDAVKPTKGWFGRIFYKSTN